MVDELNWNFGLFLSPINFLEDLWGIFFVGAFFFNWLVRDQSGPSFLPS